jgi:8-oxo-dGTP diphosphatase
MKEIHVVAGIIYSPAKDQVLIAKRPDHLHQGGLWEFPGGKVDAGESASAALVRELMEEINIQVLEAEPFHQLSHKYPDKAVSLDFWAVNRFAGEPLGLEGQEVRWVNLGSLGDYAFPEANRAVVDLVLVAGRRSND